MRKHVLKTIGGTAVVIFSLGLAPLRAAPGDVFTSDSGNVYKYDSSGQETLFATLANGSAKGIVVDALGDVFVSDFVGGASGETDDSIIKITPQGVQSVFASGLTDPRALALDSAGDLFVQPYLSDNLLRFNPQGQMTQIQGAGDNASTLTFDGSGNLFAINAAGGRINEVSSNGTVSPVSFPDISHYNVHAVAVDAAGSLFVANTDASKPIYKFSDYSSGMWTQSTFVTLDDGAAGITNMALGNSGDLYVALQPDYIEEIDSQGEETFFATSSGNSFIAVQPVPEPSTWAMAAGVGVMFGFRTRRHS